MPVVQYTVVRVLLYRINIVSVKPILCDVYFYFANAVRISWDYVQLVAREKNQQLCVFVHWRTLCGHSRLVHVELQIEFPTRCEWVVYSIVISVYTVFAVWPLCLHFSNLESFLLFPMNGPTVCAQLLAEMYLVISHRAYILIYLCTCLYWALL